MSSADLQLKSPDPQQFVCNICGKVLSKLSNLKAHINSVHFGKRREQKSTTDYVCETCDKRLSSKRSYLEHQNVHKNIRPFKCTICDYAATSHMTLRRHKQRHHRDESERSYRCVYCSPHVSALVESTGYIHHMKVKHPDCSGTFYCEPCKFSSLATKCFQEHIDKHSGGQIYGSNGFPVLIDQRPLHHYLVDDQLGKGFTSERDWLANPYLDSSGSLPTPNRASAAQKIAPPRYAVITPVTSTIATTGRRFIPRTESSSNGKFIVIPQRRGSIFPASTASSGSIRILLPASVTSPPRPSIVLNSNGGVVPRKVPILLKCTPTSSANQTEEHANEGVSQNEMIKDRTESWVNDWKLNVSIDSLNQQSNTSVSTSFGGISTLDDLGPFSEDIPSLVIKDESNLVSPLPILELSSQTLSSLPTCDVIQNENIVNYKIENDDDFDDDVLSSDSDMSSNCTDDFNIDDNLLNSLPDIPDDLPTDSNNIVCAITVDDCDIDDSFIDSSLTRAMAEGFEEIDLD